MSELESYRVDIESAGQSTRAVDDLVDELILLTDDAAATHLLDRLGVEADRLPWLHDSDYAATALQTALPRARSESIRRQMLDIALSRASWCASCATAGGEGLARSIHVRELEALRKRLSF